MAEESTRFPVETSTGLSIEFTPWTDDGKFVITKLHLFEELGGSLAHGSIDLIHNGKDEALKLITEQNTGTVIIKNKREGGLTYKIPVFISSRTQASYEVTMNLNCTPDINFITERITETYDDIDSAIDATYLGNKDIRTKPDVSVSNMSEVQQYQTKAEFCSRLCGSYKKNIVYAFGWEGLLIKDLVGIDSFGNQEPNAILEDGVSMIAASGRKFNYNYNLSESTEPYYPFTDTDKTVTSDKDYSEYEPEYVTSLISKDEYYIIGKDYSNHISNWKYNQRIFNSNLYSSFIIKGITMPNYKLGDVIKFYQTKSDDPNNPYKNYLVKSNEFFYSSGSSSAVDSNGFKISWTTLLIGLDDGDWNKKEDSE